MYGKWNETVETKAFLSRKWGGWVLVSEFGSFWGFLVGGGGGFGVVWFWVGFRVLVFFIVVVWYFVSGLFVAGFLNEKQTPQHQNL